MKMPELITKRDLIKNILVRWEETYNKSSITTLLDGRSTLAIYNDLAKLDLDTCSEEDISKIIGNSSWTYICCDQCKQSVDRAVYVGQPPNYDTPSALLCKECIIKALNKISPADGFDIFFPCRI